MGNPSPARITDEVWYFWESLFALEPTSQLGGIFANKPGYHNTRDNLPAWDYSKQLQADLQGPGDKSAALDWTFPEAQSADYARIIHYADLLLRSGQDMNDERGNVLREFYGQADWDQTVEGWDFQALVSVSSDASHLWHIHFSFLRMYVTSRWAMDCVLSILRGETVEQWRSGQSGGGEVPPVQEIAVLRRPWPSFMPESEWFGDYNGSESSHGGYYAKEKPEIKAIQQRLQAMGFDPGEVDGIFGPRTIAATEAWQARDWSSTTSLPGQIWFEDWIHMFTY